MDKTKKEHTIWTVEDEKEHNDSALEWWCIEGFFSSENTNKKFSVKGDFTEWLDKKLGPGSLYKFSFFDLNENKVITNDIRNDYERLKSSQNTLDIKFNESYMKGQYPNYEMFFTSEKDDLELKIFYSAESLPHWVAQKATGGWLPLGLGGYRYGFIPGGTITGRLKYKNQEFKIKGKGYFEHVWGDFTYIHFLENIKGMKKSLNVYKNLFNAIKKNYKVRIPQSVSLCTENNPLGYDWFWGILDNGWTVFYGNIMLWLMKGPSAGVLILSKDGKNYEEFYKSEFKYHNTKYAKDYDFCYPTDIEVTASKGDQIINLRCKMNVEPREYISSFKESKYWLGLAICEAPGKITGYYKDGDKKIDLTGICKIEPQRQITILGHNKLEINFLLPTKGFGISVNLDSHILMKKIRFKLQLIPKIKFNLKMNKIKKR